MMYSMKEACVQTGMSYETLKFYCKEGLVPTTATSNGSRASAA